MTAAAPLARDKPDPIGAIRRADWLSAERARAYGWLWLATSLVIAAGWALASRGGLDPAGKPLVTDFTSFWAASKLALGGAPASAWNVAAHHAAERAIFGREVGYAAFF